jgi:hypothetical protein
MRTLKPDDYKSHIDLYKFALEFAFKAITIFFAVVSGVLTLVLGYGTTPNSTYNPVKSALLITSFLVNLAMILGFGLTTYLWSCLSRRIRGNKKWSAMRRRKSNIGWHEFTVRLYSPSLTMILAITTTLFIVFSILLGRIMAASGVLFCDGCSLRRARLPRVAAALIVAILLIIRYRKKLAKNLSKCAKWIMRPLRIR